MAVRSVLGAFAIAAALGSAGVAAAAPSGPCQNVTYVGVCERIGDQPRTPPQQARGEVILTPNNIQNIG
ncbi:hypothetical protein [Mycolicibacterium pulveris]|uniref:hypothetical protein n=1 Tax=Mycolicibacterium pulveris TaxID=36813 RepID=UPI003CF9A285